MSRASSLKVMQHPYNNLAELDGGRARMREIGKSPGAALIWIVRARGFYAHAELLRNRPGGLALIVILPKVNDFEAQSQLIPLLSRCRPVGYLPNHQDLDASDLARVLRRPPSDLAAEVTDYIRWRGVTRDQNTLRLVRQIIDLSNSVRTVDALARSMFMSRRALGRKLTAEGLPVPSHWLQAARLLRLTLKLQNSDASLFSLACAAGYPDGFSVSNQMKRLVGTRPSIVREHLGWEWVLEAWLRSEAESGGLAPRVAGALADNPRAQPRCSPTDSRTRSVGSRRTALRGGKGA